MKKAFILHQKLKADAPPDELDVLEQARAIKHALKELGYRSGLIPVSLNLEQLKNTIVKDKPDVVVNLVETLDGQGRLIYLVAALLEFMEVPFTGSGQHGLNITTGKIMAKEEMLKAGLPTPGYFPSAQWKQLHSAKKYILKPVWEDASVGILDESVVSLQTAKQALEKALQSGINEWFFEEYIDGREFNVTLLETREGWKVFTPAEILFVGYPDDKPKILGYESKWFDESFEYKSTPRTYDFGAKDRKLISELKEISLKCVELFKLRGYVRVDFRVDIKNRPAILEINANPCLSPDAGFFAACRHAGMDYTEMIGHIIESAYK
ncbi:MAG: ATP-grasp domain-containing protein [Bacteroidales bacterium]|nr:ATP-grasp domain-containing protein [Bacteroidales bacterium]